MKNTNLLRQIIWTLVPALLILATVGLIVYKLARTPEEKMHLLEGKALASYPDYYPVRVRQDGSLFLDATRFMKAVDHFSQGANTRAAGELIYIGQHNDIALLLNDGEKSRYAMLLKNPAYASYKIKPPDDPLHTYKSVVDGIGQTLGGTGFEIVLHDTRNPMKSVVAIQNTITGRRIGDPNTNFGYELIKNYAALEEEGGNHVAYALMTKDGRKVKSTTIPLYQEKNLIGFICINIDISQLGGNNREAESALIKAFTRTSGNERIDEILENTSRNLLATGSQS